MTVTDADLAASDISWDLEPLLGDASSPDELMVAAKERAESLQGYRGRVASLDAGELAELMTAVAEINELMSRAGHYGMLRFTENTLDPERGAEMQRLQEASTAIGAQLVFVTLEFAAVDDEHAEAVLADDRLEFCRHPPGDPPASTGPTF